MAEIIARFADGRLLVQEDRTVEGCYTSGGVSVRIGLVKTVDKVLSVDAYSSGYHNEDGRLLAPLSEVKTSGDTILVVLRRSDISYTLISGLASGLASGLLTAKWGYGVMSNITSGINYLGELISGLATISGRVKVLANIIGY